MSESATRDVIFRMKAEPSKQALPNAQKFGKSIERIQSKTWDSADKRRDESLSRFNRAATQTVATERRASTEIGRLIRQRTELRRQEAAVMAKAKQPAEKSPSAVGSSKSQVDAHKRDGKAAVEAHKLATNAIAEEIKAGQRLAKTIESRVAVRQREGRAIQQAASQTADATQRAHRDHERFTSEIVSTTERASSDRLRVHNRETQAVKQELSQRESLHSRFTKRRAQQEKAAAIQSRKTRQQGVEETVKAVRETEKQMAQATSRMNAANGMLTEGLTSSGESLVRLASGLATIGLTSEANNEKLLRGLVLLRGVNDTIAGSINLWVRTGKIVEGYRLTLESVRATQAAIATQQAITAGRGAVRGTAGRAAGGVAGSVAGGAVGGAVGGRVAAAGAGAAAGKLSALQKASLAAGRGLSTFGNVASKAAPALGRLVGVLSAIDVAYSFFTTGSIGPRKGSPRGGAATSMGEASAAIGGLASRALPDAVLRGLTNAKGSAVLDTLTGGSGSVAQAELDRRKTDRMQADREKRLSREEEQRFRTGQELERTAFRADAKVRASMSAIETARGPNKLQAIDQARDVVGRQQAAIQAINVGTSDDDAEQRIDKLEALHSLDERAVELAKMRRAEEIDILQTKKQAATVAIDASREELSNAKQTLSTTKDRFEATKQALMSAEVRFGQMSEDRQKELLELSRRAQAGEDLSREERDVLLQSGIGRSRDIAQEQAIEAAKRAGFRDVEGRGLREQMRRDEAIIERQKKIVQRVQTEIEVKEEYVVTLDESVRNVREMILEEVQRANARERQIDQAERIALQRQQMDAQKLRRQNAGG